MKVTGRVVEGSKIGRTLGYPTANIAVPDGFEAADGVYAARVRVANCGADNPGGGDCDCDCGCSRDGDGERVGKIYDAMANLGVKPTFHKAGARVLELHLFDFDGNLYGRDLEIDLLEFIRPEQRFPTPEDLRMQIEKDEELIKTILKCT